MLELLQIPKSFLQDGVRIYPRTLDGLATIDFSCDPQTDWSYDPEDDIYDEDGFVILPEPEDLEEANPGPYVRDEAGKFAKGAKSVASVKELPPLKPGYTRVFHGTSSEKAAEILSKGLRTGKEIGGTAEDAPTVFGLLKPHRRFGGHIVVADVPTRDVATVGSEEVRVNRSIRADEIVGHSPPFRPSQKDPVKFKNLETGEEITGNVISVTDNEAVIRTKDGKTAFISIDRLDPFLQESHSPEDGQESLDAIALNSATQPLYIPDTPQDADVQEANPYHDEKGRFTSGPGGASVAVQTGVTYKLRSLAPNRQQLVKDAINSLPPAIQEELSGVIVERSFDDSQMGSFDHVTGTIYVNDHSKLRDDSPQEKARVAYYLETFGERHIQQTVFHEAGHALDSPIPTAAVLKAGMESATKFLSKTKFSRDKKFTKAHAAEAELLQSSTDPALKWVRHYQQDPAEAFAQAFAIVMMRRADILLTAPTAVHFEKLFPQTIARVEAMLAERGMLE